MRVLAPSSAQELQVMMADAAALADDGPVAIRYPRGRAHQVDEHEVGSGLSARCIRRARDPESSACVIAIGKLVAAAQRAADELAESDVDVTVWDARSCAPLDPGMLADAAGHLAVITVEDGVAEGGIGSSIAARVTELSTDTVTRTLGLPTRFIPHAGTPEEILTALGLDHAGIAETVRAALDASSS
jgi:1-deoxy-D-xylulose-5-phosphate synthase